MSENAQHKKTGCPIGPVELVSAYAAAIGLIDEAKLAVVTCQPVWDLLYRAKEYLRGQSAAVSREVLS